MSRTYNKITLVGNLVRDPEMRVTQGGQTVTRFTLAVNRIGVKREGAQDVDYIDIVAWDKLAERINKHVKKGSCVLVEGRLAIRPYDDKDGNKRKATEVVIDLMQFMDPAPVSNGGGSTAAGGDGEFEYQDDTEFQPV